MRKNPMAAYAEAQHAHIHCAHPVEVTVMMLNRTLEHLNTIKSLMTSGDNPSVLGTSMSKAVALLNEGLIPNIPLQTTVPEYDNMMALYDYVSRSVVQANITKDPEAIQQAINLLTQINDTWKEVLVTKLGIQP